jgi:Aldehyde dehydrogenase family
MLHIPILRKGNPYTSVDIDYAPDFKTREPFVGMSQANGGLIRRDLLDQDAMRQALASFTTRDLLDICKRGGEHFLHDSLPIGEGTQSPDDYVEQLSATTGMPYVLVRRNMQKIYNAMTKMEQMLAGLTRGVDLNILDTGFGTVDGHALSFYPKGASLGVVLPSNSPGVHALWIPSVALKIPLVLKPGSAEPWSPYRIIQALIKAGAPREAFGYYPTDHAGGGDILRNTGRGMVFGDVSSTGKWKGDPRIEIHGPGYSKVVIGEDAIENWEDYIDIIVSSIAENGGRSCINASGVWVPKYAREISDAVAAKLARIEPRSVDDPDAVLAPFADPKVAARISAMIDQGLTEEGAREVTAVHRKSRYNERLATYDSSTYLLPTIVHCESPEHNLANREFLFPYASVVEVPENEMPEVLGPTLVLTAITSDKRFVDRLISSANVDRLNVGAIPTGQISWDQPHEGNLFDHLYGRRAFQRIAPLRAA